MEKIRGVIDRFEGDNAVIRTNGDELIIPQKFVKGLSEEDVAVVTVFSAEEDSKSSKEVAEELLNIALKGE